MKNYIHCGSHWLFKRRLDLRAERIVAAAVVVSGVDWATPTD